MNAFHEVDSSIEISLEGMSLDDQNKTIDEKIN